MISIPFVSVLYSRSFLNSFPGADHFDQMLSAAHELASLDPAAAIDLFKRVADHSDIDLVNLRKSANGLKSLGQDAIADEILQRIDLHPDAFPGFAYETLDEIKKRIEGFDQRLEAANVLKKSNPDEAAKQFLDVGRDNKAEDKHVSGAAAGLAELGKKDEAIELCLKVSKSKKSSVFHKVDGVKGLIRLAQSNEATELCRRIVKDANAKIENLLEIAKCFIALNMPDEAIELSRNISVHKNASADQTAMAADCLYELGQHEEAKALYITVINSFSITTKCILKVAKKFHELGDVTTAINLYKKAGSLRHWVGFEIIFEAAEGLYQLGETDAAIDIYLNLGKWENNNFLQIAQGLKGRDLKAKAAIVYERVACHSQVTTDQLCKAARGLSELGAEYQDRAEVLMARWLAVSGLSS